VGLLLILSVSASFQIMNCRRENNCEEFDCWLSLVACQYSFLSGSRMVRKEKASLGTEVWNRVESLYL